MADGISFEELQAEWDRLGVNAEAVDALTAHELKELTGWGVEKIRLFLRKGLAAGAWECVKKTAMRIDGVASPVPAYRKKVEQKRKK